MNIIFRELKSKRKTLLIWTLIIVFFALLGFSEGSAFVGDTSVEIEQLMEVMPEGLMKAFSMDGFDMSTAEGYFGIMVIYFALILGIYSVMTTTSTVLSEERDKTAEFSLVLPIKRHQLLTAKLVVVFFYGVLLNLITLGCSMVFGNTVEAGSVFYDYLILCSVAMLLIQVFFMAIGFFIGCAFKNHKRAGGLSVSILMATYFFSVFAGIHENLEFFKYLTPFKFFDFYLIQDTGKLSFVYTIITLALSIILITAGYIIYCRRDIHV